MTFDIRKRNENENLKFGDNGDGTTYVQTRDTFNFIDFAYDYTVLTNPNSTTDLWTFKTGGSGGTTVATVTIVYTDTTKCVIDDITKVNI